MEKIDKVIKDKYKSMFEFSLGNGKRQLIGGLKLLMVSAILAVVFGLLMLITNPIAQLVFIILFSIPLGIIGLLTLIKLIFGIVVYHAERTGK